MNLADPLYVHVVMSEPLEVTTQPLAIRGVRELRYLSCNLISYNAVCQPRIEDVVRIFFFCLIIVCVPFSFAVVVENCGYSNSCYLSEWSM